MLLDHYTITISFNDLSLAISLFLSILYPLNRNNLVYYCIHLYDITQYHYFYLFIL